MIEFKKTVIFTVDGEEVEHNVVIECEQTGAEEAATMDSPGCDAECEYTVYDADTGNEFPQFMAVQLEDEFNEWCWEELEKKCEDDAMEYASELAAGA